MSTSASTPPSKRTLGAYPNRRRAQFVEKLQSKRKTRRTTPRGNSIQPQGKSGSSTPRAPDQTEIASDPTTLHRAPGHADNQRRDPAILAQYDGPSPGSAARQGNQSGFPAPQGPNPMADILSSLLGLSPPGGNGAEPGGGGPMSMLNTLAMMGIALPGMGGLASNGLGGGAQGGAGGSSQAGSGQAAGSGLGLEERLSELARLKAELASIDDRLLPGPQGPPNPNLAPTPNPADEDDNWVQHQLPVSVLDMLAVVHALRDMLNLQIDVEGGLAERLEILPTDTEVGANAVRNIKDLQTLLEKVRELTERQLEMMDGFAKKAEACVAEVQKQTAGLPGEGLMQG